MVKADLTRDYYGDLDLPPSADTTDIKKQFKKLALTYHPDRNPGRESEVTAKFQKIQSAHEVLIDPTERAKYDSNRVRGSSSNVRNAYGGQASGTKGNPWANAGSQWAPPPKPPTTRNKYHPPPPSAGAGRYAKFATPNTSAYQASQEGPEARKAQYEAWDRTRHQADHGPGKAPQPPPRGAPTSRREESNTQSNFTRSKPSFQEFRDRESAKNQGATATSRKGFMPNTPGGDEPPAPKGSYSTQRDKPSVAPDPPPRHPVPEMSESARPSTRPDPLKKFRMEPTMEERVSTPYATHGGEKFNPFESAAAGVNRSKSARERNEAFGKGGVPKNDSDTNLRSKAGTPNRARSFASPRTSHVPRPSFAESVDMDSSSDEPFQMPKPTTRTRRSNGGTPQNAKQTDPTTNLEPQSTSKQTSRVYQFRQWMKENPGQEPPPNGFGAEGPPLRSGQPNQSTPKTNGEPSMYATPASSTFNQASASIQAFASNQTPTSNPRRNSSYSVKLETLAERIAKTQARSATYPPRNVDNPKTAPATGVPETPPSGVSPIPGSLNAFEEMQRSYVDRLLSNKRQGSFEPQFKTLNGEAPKTDAGSQPSGSMNSGSDKWTNCREVTEPGSPAKKLKSQTPLRKAHAYDFQKCNSFWNHLSEIKTNANARDLSFSFNLNNESFAQTQSTKPNGFSNSTDNISTKFTPEDWDGKFAAGGNYFQPVKVPSTPQRPRSQSNSRSRGRSPIKIQPTFGMPARSEEQTPIESPGGTKFSAQDWAETFKPQTFAPPQMPPPRGGPIRKKSTRPTMGGNAAVVDEGDTSDEKPLFTDHQSASPQKSPPVSPEPMDVDTPPGNRTIPMFAQAKVNGKLNAEHLKRPAASASTSPVDTELKVAFEDMKVKDIISTLDMPLPPTAPSPPTTEGDIPTRPAYDDYIDCFEKYMQEWDRFNAKFLLHMVARKNQNDDLKEQRWTDDKGLETYRQGLKEDQAVMHKWAEHTSVHEAVVKCFVIMKERMKVGEATADPKRPRKKTH